MPHFVVDYSANLHDKLEFEPLFKRLHEYVVSTGAFPIGGARSRAIRCDDYYVADGREEFAYINMTLKIGAGRPFELREEVAKRVFEIFTDWMKPITEENYVMISFEMSELEPVLKFNKNNIHALFKD